MTPSEAQQHALDELEKASGRPVVVREDAGLQTMARIQMASSTRPAHVLGYSPTAASQLAYLVCFQCALAKRVISAAPDERFNVASTNDTYRQVETLVREKKSIPAQAIQSYSQIITDGLGTQLRSMPIGIRVDRQLFRDHPELRDQQRAAAERSMKENAGCLHPNVRAHAPEMIFQATAAMNAAYAIGWARLWSDESHAVPYRLAGLEERGRQLLDVLDAAPDSPTYDRELVSAWATLLGIDHLYRIGPVGL